jgi:hypothetical protein
MIRFLTGNDHDSGRRPDRSVQRQLARQGDASKAVRLELP